MDPMTTLSQIFEATAADLRLFDATIKSLIKEFAAGAMTGSNGVGSDENKPPPDLAASILQKYRQMTVLFLIKMMNHLVIINNLQVPCTSCGVHQPITTTTTTTAASSTTAIAPTTSVPQLLAPMLAASTDPRLNITAALSTDTMAAISPLLAAAAVLTPPTSDSTSLLATASRPDDSSCSNNNNSCSNNSSNELSNAAGNTAQQYALLAQQKLAALVQLHHHQQRQQNQLQPMQQGQSDSEKAVNNDSDGDYDNSADDGDGDIDVAADDQPIDMSSSSHLKTVTVQQPVVDENRPPNNMVRQSLATGITLPQNQYSSGSTSSSASSLVSPSTANIAATPATATMSTGPTSAFLNPTIALSDALGRVVNRLPVPANTAAAAAAAAAAAGGVFGLGCTTATSDITNAYAKFQSAIASAVTSNQRAAMGAKTHLTSNTEIATATAASPFAALAQHLFPSANSNSSGLLSPAVVNFAQHKTSQQVQQRAAVSPTEPLPLCLSAVGSSQPSGNSSGSTSNRRASLPPYMLSSQSNQSASMISPGASSSGGHHVSSAGVRTADRYRVVYTSSQTFELEQEYRQNKFITITRKKELARQLGLNERQVKIWFQNRRAKDKRAHRRGADSASGGELAAGENLPPRSAGKSSKNRDRIKEENVDGSATSVGNAGSCSSISSTAMLNQHDTNSNSNNSYDGSVQARDGGGPDDVEVDDSDEDCDDMIDDDENEDEVQQLGRTNNTQAPVISAVVYPPPAAMRFSSSSSSSASSSTSTSSSLSSLDQQPQLMGCHMSSHQQRQSLAANGIPLLLVAAGSQSIGGTGAAGPMVINSNATAMEIN